VRKPAQEPARRTRFLLLLDLFVAAIAGRWRRFEIAESSMCPTLGNGDWVLGVARTRRLRIGDVVVCDHPDRPGFAIVKRIASIDPTDGSLWLLSDDPTTESVDSRSFGTVPATAVTARLALRYRPVPPVLIR